MRCLGYFHFCMIYTRIDPSYLVHGFTYSFAMPIIFKQIDLTHRWDANKYYYCVRVDLGVITRKGYSIIPRASELELHHQMQFHVILSKVEKKKKEKRRKKREVAKAKNKQKEREEKNRIEKRKIY